MIRSCPTTDFAALAGDLPPGRELFRLAIVLGKSLLLAARSQKERFAWQTLGCVSYRDVRLSEMPHCRA
jgi:hypothetical protein